MWKIALGFVVFAGLALFILMKSGADIDMSGEKHGSESTAAPGYDTGAPAPGTPAAVPAAPAVAASGASAPAASASGK